MSDALTTPFARPVEDLEAFQELRSRASGKLGRLPAEMVARHVLTVTVGADWPVQRAALEAVVRRHAFARRDGLEVAARPRGRIGLGLYETRRRQDGTRPYQTLLAAVAPLMASCGCKDFQKGGLGLCKHVLVALEDLLGKPSKWERAVAAGTGLAARGARLVWDPVRPLTGPGDWLDRVAWAPGASGNGGGRLPKVVETWFAIGAGETWPLAGGAPQDPPARLSLVDGLRRHVQQQAPGNGRMMVSDPALLPLLDAERQRLGRLQSGEVISSEMDSELETMKKPLTPSSGKGWRAFSAPAGCSSPTTWASERPSRPLPPVTCCGGAAR